MLKAGAFPRAFCFKPSLLSELSKTLARLRNGRVGHLGLKVSVARLVDGPVAVLAVGLAPGVVMRLLARRVAELVAGQASGMPIGLMTGLAA